MRLLVYIMLLATCYLLPVVGFPQSKKDDWILYKSENGISVYSRKTANSDYKEIKSVFSAKTSLSSIIALIYDWDSYPEWNYRCGESKTLKKINETELIHYQTTKTPWPAQDQDFIIDVKLTQDEKTKVITITSTNMPNYIPPYKDRARLAELKGLWTIIPSKDGTVQLTYKFMVKPGGYVPVWLVNMAVLSGPYETMAAFKEWLKKDKYQKAKSTLIKELN